MSEADEADNEVGRLTAMAFHSLSCPEEHYLPRQQPAAHPSPPRLTANFTGGGAPSRSWRPDCTAAVSDYTPDPSVYRGESGREHFECVDVAVETGSAKKDWAKKTVPKRQILLKRTGRDEVTDCAETRRPARRQPALPVTREARHLPHNTAGQRGYHKLTHESEAKEKIPRAVSLDEATHNSCSASTHVKKVLAKKMQVEQRLRRQKELVCQSGEHAEGLPMPPWNSDSDSADSALKQKPFKTQLSKYASQDAPDCGRQGSESAPESGVEKCTLKNVIGEYNTCPNCENGGEISKLQSCTCDSRRDNGSQRGVSDTSIGVEKTGRNFTKIKTQLKAHQFTEKALDTDAGEKTMPFDPTGRTARQISHALSEEQERDTELENLFPPPKVFTSKTPQIKIMHQPNIDQKNSTFSNCTFITLQKKPEENTSLAVPRPGLSTPAVVTCLNQVCDDSANGSNSPHSKTREANRDDSKSQSWMHVTKDIKKTNSDICQPPVRTPETQLNSLFCPSQEGSASNIPHYIQTKATAEKEVLHNAVPLHEKQKYSNFDLVDDVKIEQLSIKDQNTNQHSASMHNQTKQVGGIEYATLSAPSVNNVKSSSEGENVNVLCEKDYLKKKPKTSQSQISELNVLPTVKPTTKVTKEHSDLSFRINSKPSHPELQPKCGSPARTEAALEAADDLQFPHLSHSFEDSAGPASSSHVTSRHQSFETPAGLSKETARTIGNNSKGKPERSTAPWPSEEAYEDVKTEFPLQKNLFSETITATLQEDQHFAINPVHSQDGSWAPSPPTIGNEGLVNHQCISRQQPIAPRSLEARANAEACNTMSAISESVLSEKKMQDTTQKLDVQPRLPDEGSLEYCSHSNTLKGNPKKASPASTFPLSPSTSVQAQRHELNSDELSTMQHIKESTKEQASSLDQPGSTSYLTLPFQEQTSAAVRPPASSHPKSSTASSASSAASSISNFSFFSQGDCEMPQSPTQEKGSHEAHLEKPTSKAPYENVKLNRKRLLHVPEKANPCCVQANDGIVPYNRSVPGHVMPCMHHPQIPRKMLIDPDSGKCYYIEPPRQPQLRLLYDPETGQYVEVLIPPIPLAPHSGLFQPPIPPMVLAQDCFRSPYLQYPGFPGFSLPTAMPTVMPDLPHPHLRHENQGISSHCDHISKQEVHTNQLEHNPLERQYYIPTGMNSSPSPSQSLSSHTSCGSPNTADKGQFSRVPFCQTHNKAHLN